MRLYPTLATPGTPIDCHQPTLLYVELLLLIHHPLVVPMAAQGLAFMFFLEGAFLEGEDVGHAKSMGASTMASNQRPPHLLIIGRSKRAACGRSAAAVQVLLGPPFLIELIDLAITRAPDYRY